MRAIAAGVWIGKRRNTKLERVQESYAGPSWIGSFQNDGTKLAHCALLSYKRLESIILASRSFPHFISLVRYIHTTNKYSYFPRGTMISLTSQQKGESSSSIQSPSVSTSSASPYTFSLGRPGAIKPPPSPSHGRSRLIPPVTQSQNRPQLFSKPQSFARNSAVIDNRPNSSTNTPSRVKSTDAKSGSGHTKMAQPSAARVLVGSTHGTELPTLQRQSVSSTLRGPGLIARSNRPPYTLTITPPTVMKSTTLIKTEEERWARIQYLREKAEKARLELLAWEQEEQDLISHLTPAISLNRLSLSTHIGATSPVSPISSLSPPVSPLSPVMINDGDQCPDHAQTRVAMARTIWDRWPEERPTIMTLSMDDSTVFSPDDVEEVLNGHLNNFHEGNKFQQICFSLIGQPVLTILYLCSC